MHISFMHFLSNYIRTVLFMRFVDLFNSVIYSLVLLMFILISKFGVVCTHRVLWIDKFMIIYIYIHTYIYIYVYKKFCVHTNLYRCRQAGMYMHI